MATWMERVACWEWSEAGIELLEEVISKDQFEIIRLAFIGLGISFDGAGWWSYGVLDGHPSIDGDVPLSFARLCTKLHVHGQMDAPYLLYVVLLGVGVNGMLLEKVGFDCGTEIDIKFLYTNYPKFSVLLAVGNMVMSMSDSKYQQFCSNIRFNLNRGFVNYNSRCNAVAYSEIGNIVYTDLPQGYAGFTEFLHQCNYLSYNDVHEYFDSLGRKHRPKAARQNPRLKAVAQRALQKGMEEGYVSLNNIKMVICGPPFVGKTAFKHLLLNKPPPLKHNSTPIAARPIQAMRIAAGDNTWEEANEEDLLHMLSDAIEKKTTQSLQEEYSTIAATIPVLPEQTNDEKDYSVSSSPHVDAPATNSTSLVLAPSAQKESLPSVHEPLFVHGAKAMNDDYVSRKIIEQLSSSKERKGSQKLLEATWIHLLDSGGQPQFIDLLHMFVRDNSLYIIVMKVTESLHDKPMFVYSLNGSPLSVPQEMTMTNLQIIESFVRSVAVASRYNKSTKPAFAIVATNCDRSKLRRFVGLDEKLNTKDKVLQECLSEFLDLFIFYNRDSDELIFPVDNLCWWNRQKISADIRSHLLCSRSDIGLNVKIPIRWYVFDLNTKKEASKEAHGIISLGSCFNIGHKFGMNESEVLHCLNLFGFDEVMYLLS